jgi:flagellar basal-body rod modification protein FlgD
MATVAGLGSSTPTSSTNTLANPKSQLQVSDFINMMVTQLQNQDPLSPESNSDLLQQMSQIGQLQSSTQLTTSLQNMVIQNSLGSAGNLIGKTVQGLDTDGAPLQGVVDSVKVKGSDVFLELDSGKELNMTNVTSISATPTTAAAATTPATTPTATAPIAG